MSDPSYETQPDATPADPTAPATATEPAATTSGTTDTPPPATTTVATDTPPAPAAAPANTTAADTPLVAQFGGVAAPVKDAQPAVTDEGGYVSAKPLLTTGSYGPFVAELAKLLHEAGFPNDVHAGTAAPMLDNALMRLVRAFQDSIGHDPSQPQDGAAPLVRSDHEGIVDARTWEALLGDAAALVDRYPHEIARVI